MWWKLFFHPPRYLSSVLIADPTINASIVMNHRQGRKSASCTPFSSLAFRVSTWRRARTVALSSPTCLGSPMAPKWCCRNDHSVNGGRGCHERTSSFSIPTGFLLQFDCEARPAELIRIINFFLFLCSFCGLRMDTRCRLKPL